MLFVTQHHSEVSFYCTWGTLNEPETWVDMLWQVGFNFLVIQILVDSPGWYPWHWGLVVIPTPGKHCYHIALLLSLAHRVGVDLKCGFQDARAVSALRQDLPSLQVWQAGRTDERCSFQRDDGLKLEVHSLWPLSLNEGLLQGVVPRSVHNQGFLCVWISGATPGKPAPCIHEAELRCLLGPLFGEVSGCCFQDTQLACCCSLP